MLRDRPRRLSESGLRTYETDDGTVNVSLRPEHLTIVDEATRTRWVTETAERTLERIDAIDGQGTEYAPMAREHYGDVVAPTDKPLLRR